MRKIFLTLTLLAATAATAQETLDKQLEVTREYTPSVARAAKLGIEPNMIDTLKLRPEVFYRITPAPWPTSFGVERFAPARIDTRALEDPHSLYVRLGVGAPFQTTGDVYFTPRMKANSAFGIFVNHRGSWSKLENELGIKGPAAEMYNAVGLWGKKKWNRYSLSGELSYDMHSHDEYGVSKVDPTLFTGNKLGPEPTITTHFDGNTIYQKYGRVQGALAFGDDFTDLSRFNFRVGVDGGYSTEMMRQMDVNARVKIARTFAAGRHGFSLEVWERGAFIGDLKMEAATIPPIPGLPVYNDPKRDAIAIVASPRYMLHLGKFRFTAGVDARMVSNDFWNQEYFRLTPTADASFELAGGRFVPFLSYSSSMIDGSKEALSRRNPYVVGDGPTGWRDDALLGFAGNVDNVFSYKIFGGVSFLSDYNMLVAQNVILLEQVAGARATYDAYYWPVNFRALPADGSLFRVGGELGLHDLGGFSASLAGNWYKFDDMKYTTTTGSPVGDLPKYDATVELTYRHPRESFRVTLGATLLGERKFNNDYYIIIAAQEYLSKGSFVNTLGPVVDIFASAEVKLMNGFWVFLDARNLAGQKLFPYNYYRGLGANVMVGVKAVF